MSTSSMTDEQRDELKQQILQYGKICESLVEMHKGLTREKEHPAEQQQTEQEANGSDNTSPVVVEAEARKREMSIKLTPLDSRWRSTAEQREILEKIYDEEGIPKKARIKDITVELKKYGPVGELNVFNWFHNRKGRDRRKKQRAQ